jgi:hypothetical protein
MMQQKLLFLTKTTTSFLATGLTKKIKGFSHDNELVRGVSPSGKEKNNL